jgi:hypothetical protein
MWQQKKQPEDKPQAATCLPDVNKTFPFQTRRIEVHKIPDFKLGKMQVVDNLSVHNRREVRNRFKSDDNFVIYDKVCNVGTVQKSMK